MNIVEIEAPKIEAKTCGNSNEKVTYRVIDSSYGLCADKKEILLREIGACETLLKLRSSENDKMIIRKEIAELRTVLDLMS
jgi:hypothetical protein